MDAVEFSARRPILQTSLLLLSFLVRESPAERLARRIAATSRMEFSGYEAQFWDIIRNLPSGKISSA
jgi:hypothetical protein